MNRHSLRLVTFSLAGKRAAGMVAAAVFIVLVGTAVLGCRKTPTVSPAPSAATTVASAAEVWP